MKQTKLSIGYIDKQYQVECITLYLPIEQPGSGSDRFNVHVIIIHNVR